MGQLDRTSTRTCVQDSWRVHLGWKRWTLGQSSYLVESSNGLLDVRHLRQIGLGDLGQQELPEGQQGTEALPRTCPVSCLSFPGPSWSLG